MKLKSLAVVLLVTLFVVILAFTASAQGEPPPPYAGLENPFPWEDSSAQAAGVGVYKQSCLGCHGLKGDNLAEYNFSKADYSQGMEARPDYYYWVLSEGRMDKGMPGYGSSLSEEQRWQVLTYLRSLGVAVPEVILISEVPGEAMEGTLQLTVPGPAESGRPLTLEATLQDDQDKPIVNATVKFFLSAELFTRGLMEIGEEVTDGQGVAVLEYTPRQSGEFEMAARYGAIETMVTVSVAEGEDFVYETEAGLQFPKLGGDILIGPESALDLGEESNAPASAFRLAGGVFSWLMLVVVTVFFIWFTYFRILYQVFRIPIVSEIRGVNTRLVSIFGLVMVVIMGTLLIIMLVTGPYSHLNLPR
ncbi:MAG: c-type cytochrome [Dehalococcoidales bacterium]